MNNDDHNEQPDQGMQMLGIWFVISIFALLGILLAYRG